MLLPLSHWAHGRGLWEEQHTHCVEASPEVCGACIWLVYTSYSIHITSSCWNNNCNSETTCLLIDYVAYIIHGLMSSDWFAVLGIPGRDVQYRSISLAVTRTTLVFKELTSRDRVPSSSKIKIRSNSHVVQPLPVRSISMSMVQRST